jgi:DNA repair protein RecN (Recombination protein N)
MLRDLYIKDFAIIDSLHLSFAEGLNVLSGETGAGKSIIVGALNLLLGGRASADLIRTAKDEALVEAVFDIESCPETRQCVQSWGIDSEDSQLIIRRIIARSGKNKIFIGDRLATMQMLTQLGSSLLDISGQYSQQLLLQTENHLDILDTYGGLLPLRTDYQEQFNRYTDMLRELNGLLELEKNKSQRRDLLSFQYDELEKVQLVPGEEEELLKERQILAHAEKLYEKTYGVYSALYEADEALLGNLKKAAVSVEEAAGIDNELNPLRENLNSLIFTLEDVALSLRGYAEKIPLDSGRRELVENRLSDLQRLKKKYGKSASELISYQQEIEQELSALQGSSQRIEALREELHKEAHQLWKAAEEISSKRQQAARSLKKLIEQELATIGMKKTAFFTMMEKAERPAAVDDACSLGGLSSRGMDTAEFYIAPNVGEEPRPLSKIASGGELSRIVLAIKKIVARHYRVGTLLFDEVDAGIGGAVAESVGEKLQEISGTHQVLCITHLPQIACFGSAHFSVRKIIQDGRTITSVQLLDADERLDEITRMLGGKNITEKTRAHALEMLKGAGKKAPGTRHKGEEVQEEQAQRHKESRRKVNR